MIMLQVRSPMLVAVGMYLPLTTTFAIFIGGLIRWFSDVQVEKRKLNEAQRVRVENIGVLTASGLIAGEALVGLVIASFFFFEIPVPVIFENPSYALGLGVMAVLAFLMIRTPLANAGRPDEPAPPAAMM
jgi:magnesium-transporting ATPase (P-type)